MVRTSPMAGCRTRRRAGAYAMSMRCGDPSRSTDRLGKPQHGLPGRQDVPRRVQIPIVQDPACGARPLRDTERQGRDDVPTLAAHLGRREEAIHADHLLAISLGLVVEHPNSDADAGIAQAAGKGVAPDHAAQVQILDADHVELAHQPCRELVQRVLARMGDLLVTAGQPCYLGNAG